MSLLKLSSVHSENQAHAGECSLGSWSLQLDNLFAFGAVEKEQQCGIDGIDHFSLPAFRTGTRASVRLARRKIVPVGRLEV